MLARVIAALALFKISLAADVHVGLLLKRDAIAERWFESNGRAMLAPAVAAAVAEEAALDGATFNFSSRLAECADERAQVSALIELAQSGVQAVFGPACGGATELLGMVAAEYNVTLIHWSSAARNADTSIALAGTLHTMAASVAAYVAHFGWSRVALFHSADSARRQCASLSAVLKGELTAHHVDVSYNAEVGGAAPTDAETASFVELFPRRSRIVFVCLAAGVDSFMAAVAAANLTSESGFVYLLPDFQHFHTGHNDGCGENTHSAFMISQMTAESTYAYSYHSAIREYLENSATGLSAKHVVDIDQCLRQDALCSPFLHDAVILYAKLVRQCGAFSVMNCTTSVHLDGASGAVLFGEGDFSRRPAYALVGCDSADQRRLVATSVYDRQMRRQTVALQVEENDLWYWASGRRPTGEPYCGWTGTACLWEDIVALAKWVIIGTLGAALIGTVSFYGLIVYIKRRVLVNEMAQMIWKVDYAEVVPLRRLHNRASASFDKLANMTDEMRDAMLHGHEHTAHFRGQIVWMKQHRGNVVVDIDKQHVHVKAVKDLAHDNLNPFVGLCLNTKMPVSLWSYAVKGSLDEVLASEATKMDWFFKFSLIRDLSKGMHKLHEAGVGSHGHLKSSNCLIDSRWMLRITDYGLHSLRAGVTPTMKDKMWLAPELLRDYSPSGTKPADVYSYGIVVSEIITRERPYAMYGNMPLEELLRSVQRGSKPPFRPKLAKTIGEASDVEPMMLVLLEDSWSEEPDERPAFDDIDAFIHNMGKGKPTNLMEHALKMMESYAARLESQVTDRTQRLFDASERAERLLSRMLPQSVAAALKAGVVVEPETFDEATVFFSDVAQFEQLTARSKPIEIVNLLNQLYTLLDSIVDDYDVYKVETINDSYMVASGLPHRNGDRHASQIADMALHFQIAISGFYVPHLAGEKLQLRVGMHTGSVVAGVVGLSMPRYCLFGDTVNVASRIETNGKPSCIHLSDECNRYLTQVVGGYLTKERGEIIVKGKGIMTTYWLLGKSSVKQDGTLEEELSDEEDYN